MILPMKDKNDRDENWNKNVWHDGDMDLVEDVGSALMDVAVRHGASLLQMYGAIEVAKQWILEANE